MPDTRSADTQPALCRSAGLCLIITLALYGNAATAQTPDVEQLEEMIVVGRGMEETIPLELAGYGNRIEVITSEDIEQRGFIDLGQTLQMMVPGLHIAPKNGPFDYAQASLQGSRTAEILWLIDGVRINNRLYNSTSPLDTIPAHMVERIEVLKGGQGIFYGTQSVGGVINIVTKSFSEESGGAVSTGVNSNDGYNLHGYYRGSLGDNEFVAYASHDEAEGYQPFRDEAVQPSATDLDRGYEVTTVGLKLARDVTPDARLSLQYQLTDNALDFARPFLNHETRNERREDILTVKYDHRFSEHAAFFVKAYYHEWDTRYTRIYNVLDEQGQLTGDTRVLNDASYWGYKDSGLNAMTRFDFDNGLEYVLGFDHQNFSGADEVWRIADRSETVNAAFAQLRTTEEWLENTAIALGVRHNRPSVSRDSTVWNLSARHDFSDSLYLRTNLGTSFLLPDAEALFLREIDDPDNDGVPDGGYFAVGNPDLEPERSRNINIGLGGNVGPLQFELIGFDRRITDYIASYVPTTIGGVTGETFRNSDDEVRVRGGELISSAALGASWNASFSYTRTRSELNEDGTQLTGIPESEAKLGLEYQASGLPWGATLSMNHVGDVTGRSGADLGYYTVVDLSGHYIFGGDDQHRLVLRIENLTDAVYATSANVATRDTGGTYLYDNLGMKRTVHVSYTFRL